MQYKITKNKVRNFSIFYIKSKKFGYGHYNRIKNLISIIKNKNKKFFHHCYGETKKSKNNFFKKLGFEVNLNRNIVLDFTNDLFLNKSSILKLKKIFSKKVNAKIYIIDSPTQNNLSTILDFKYAKTLIPFDVTRNVKKKILKIKNKKIGLQYFIYPDTNIKKSKKSYDITLSFGGSDKYKGTLYVLKLLEYCKVNKNILIINGKYFKENYKKKILSICKKNKYKIISFSGNFSGILNKSRLLITNSGLTKYEGYLHGLKVIVFSDSKKSQKIDKIFMKKTEQLHFSYSKNLEKDKIMLSKVLNRNSSFKTLDKNILKSNNKNILNFFKNG